MIVSNESLNQFEITPNGLKAQLDDADKIEIIDIRRKSDYEAFHIPGSIHIDAYQALHDYRPGPLAHYSPTEGITVVTVCYVGITSQVAAQYLRTQGIQALSLVGGIDLWLRAANTNQRWAN
ncbi:MAG: rhodanese-like domain-containing protein [Anaerolineales bacterium]|nr:rhodanese-like domain-containing protein [Anaerolineales bacterium]